ncbi:hypothetical protein AVEN_95123-1 [Araneus ventricosus]|uniref:RNase H type-1 domain-containing protein n=1 Tax=Araneus ventricosus TaxID=182803 RepID=A0A4Y2WJ79_ARAVE|nr:hypothetical protein AVEN_95123-1 [Araneus ventricosus]
MELRSLKQSKLSLERKSFCFDSRSALMALSAVEEARDIINNIKEYKGKITLTWIRAHMGNFGNERADQLAKEATLISDETISFVPSRNQIRNEGNKITKDLWQNRWNDSKKGAMVQKPNR